MSAEWLLKVELRLPAGLEAPERERLLLAERTRGRELRADGTIVRIWRVPGRSGNVAVWRAADASELHAKIATLPLFPHLDVTVTPLALHPVEAAA